MAYCGIQPLILLAAVVHVNQHKANTSVPLAQVMKRDSTLVKLYKILTYTSLQRFPFLPGVGAPFGTVLPLTPRTDIVSETQEAQHSGLPWMHLGVSYN